MEINRDKHIWEGWTVGDFIDDIEVTFDYRSKYSNFWKSKEDLKKWIMSEQPYYKKYIPEVYNYFLNKTDL